MKPEKAPSQIVDTEDHFSRNYQVIKAQVTKDGYFGLAALKESNRRVQEMGVKMSDDLRPVSLEEGQNIFNEYYKEKSVKDHAANKKKMLDFKRKRHQFLLPVSNESYLYRPKSKLKRSGPETYDMSGVDDDPESLIGMGMPSFESMFSSFKNATNKS